jgi:hypothetical protein
MATLAWLVLGMAVAHQPGERLDLGRGWSVMVPGTPEGVAAGPVRARGTLGEDGAARFVVVVVGTGLAATAEEARPGRPAPLAGYAAVEEPSPELSWLGEEIAREDSWKEAVPETHGGITWARHRGTARFTRGAERDRGFPGPCEGCVSGGMCCVGSCARLGGAPVACCGSVVCLPWACAASLERAALDSLLGRSSEPDPHAPQSLRELQLTALSVRLGPETLYILAAADTGKGAVADLEAALATMAASLSREPGAGPSVALEPCGEALGVCASPPDGESATPALSCAPDRDGTARCVMPPPDPVIHSF